MDSSKIKLIFIVVLAMFFAIYLGVAAATAQLEAIAWIVGFGGLIFVFAMGKHVWLLIPAGLVLQGKINFLPGTPPVWALCTAVVAGMFTLRFAMRRPDFIWRPTLIDIAVLIQLLAIGQAYARNPTGLLIMGGEMAGGKSYLEFGVAIVAFFCLSLPRPDWRFLKWAVIIMVVVSILDSCISLASDWIPAFAAAVLPLYSNVNFATAYTGAAERDLDVQRGGGGLAQLGRALALPCLMMARPLQCMSPLHPILFFSVALGAVGSLLSGFRSLTAYLLVIFIVSALIRKKYLEILLACVIGFLGLSILIASGSVRHLPFGVQRILSALPIEVSAAARVDAEKSSEWRFEMWELVLTTDKYIQNKWLGDGFGLKSTEMRAMADAAMGYKSALTDSQEQALARGSYHGFHVETIRFTGWLGLTLAVFANFVFFFSALRSVNHYRGNPNFAYVAYLTIPFLIYPFWSLLVFGSYRTEFPQILAMTGLLKMLDNLRRSDQEAIRIASSEQRLPNAKPSSRPLPGLRSAAGA
jgi:hypothetical protein